jgi:hypothetical protein
MTTTTNHLLPYLLPKFREDLAAEPVKTEFELEKASRPYSHATGRRFGADFGLIVEYRDGVRPDRSFTTCALVQAKRLYRTDFFGQYTISDGF